MRLDKLLGDYLNSRSSAKKEIKSGKVLVNGITTKKNDTQINKNDIVLYNGKEVKDEFIYYMLNKPKGVVSATRDNVYKTVIDLIVNEDKVRNLFPVGRLDVDTTGLLIITNNGQFAHNTLSPKKHVSKKYYVTLKSDIQESYIEKFKEGIKISNSEQCKPAILEIINTKECKLEIFEGKFHQVKKMFLAVGNEVCELKRISFGALKLDETLNEGDYRLLKNEEKELLEIIE
ncbi:MAG: 16S rRNA pseudouridine(516) synthase [Lachnospirales bacterium]